MLSKLKKTPQYFQGFKKRTNSIGFFVALKELIKYNRFYYNLLKRNGVPVNWQTVGFHTSTYTKICRMLPHLSHDELMKFIPTSVTHGIYKKLDINRREITYDKYKMYLRMAKAGISIPEIYFVSDDKKKNIWFNKISEKELDDLSKTEKIIAKPRFGNAGEGIYMYNGGKILPNYVYQKFVYNHSSIIKFQGNEYCSVVRYVVYNQKGRLSLLGSRFDINSGSVIANTKHGASSVILDEKSGRIISCGFYADGSTYHKHPVTFMNVNDFVLPNWNIVLEEINKTCIEYKELPLIAFDLAITKDGCKVLEINAGCGTLFSQYSERWLEHQFVKDFYPKR